METRSASMLSVMIGSIADFWRAIVTLPTEYWKSAPSFAPDAIDWTDRDASINAGASAAMALLMTSPRRKSVTLSLARRSSSRAGAGEAIATRALFDAVPPS